MLFDLKSHQKTLLFTHFDFLNEISFSENVILYVFGHIHKDTFCMIKHTHIYSINGCDSDKSIGAPPQVTYFEIDGEQIHVTKKAWEQAISFVKMIKPDGITVHVPKASVENMTYGAKEKIGGFIAKKFNELPARINIEIENMHTTPGEPIDSRCRYGYLPEECLEWALYLSELSSRKISLHLDVGHDRNNRPFSEKYSIGVWYEMIGKNINAYHIHQTANNQNVFSNHHPIGGIYEELISYCSFLESWKTKRIAHRPMFVEVADL